MSCRFRGNSAIEDVNHAERAFLAATSIGARRTGGGACVAEKPDVPRTVALSVLGSFLGGSLVQLMTKVLLPDLTSVLSLTVRLYISALIFLAIGFAIYYLLVLGGCAAAAGSPERESYRACSKRAFSWAGLPTRFTTTFWPGRSMRWTDFSVIQTAPMSHGSPASQDGTRKARAGPRRRMTNACCWLFSTQLRRCSWRGSSPAMLARAGRPCRWRTACRLGGAPPPSWIRRSACISRFTPFEARGGGASYLWPALSLSLWQALSLALALSLWLSLLLAPMSLLLVLAVPLAVVGTGAGVVAAAVNTSVAAVFSAAAILSWRCRCRCCRCRCRRCLRCSSNPRLDGRKRSPWSRVGRVQRHFCCRLRYRPLFG